MASKDNHVDTVPPEDGADLDIAAAAAAAAPTPLRSTKLRPVDAIAESPSVVDALCLQLDVTSPTKASSKPSEPPTAWLAPSDAQVVDVASFEEVFLIVAPTDSEKERNRQVSAVSSAVRCRVLVDGESLPLPPTKGGGAPPATPQHSTPIQSPPTNSQKKKKHPTLACGRLRVLPPTVVESLVPETNNGPLLGSPSNPSGVVQSSPTPSTPESSSTFSFKNFASSPPTASKTRSPSFSPTPRSATSFRLPGAVSPSHTPKVWVVPVESVLGRRLETRLCRKARVLRLQLLWEPRSLPPPLPPNQSTPSIPPPPLDRFDLVSGILSRIVLAQLAGRWVQPRELVVTTFQGRSIRLRILDVRGLVAQPEDPAEEAVAAAPNTSSADDAAVTAAFRGLSLENDQGSDEDATSAVDSTPAAWVPAIQSCTNLRLYKVTYSTSIEWDLSPPYCSSEPIQAPKRPGPGSVQCVAGLDAVVRQLRTHLRTLVVRADLFRRRHLAAPRGLLLHGPSGVGKTALLRQLAAEIAAAPPEEYQLEVEHVNCASLQSQTTVVGQAERHLSRLFRPPPLPMRSSDRQKGKLLILDDVHLLCPRRGSHHAPGIDRLAATLLSLIDGVDSSYNVFLLAATHSPSLLDPALRRPGRIDTELEVPVPEDARTRAAILRFHVGQLGAHAADDVDTEQWLELGRLAKGFNGADCMLAVKEAMRHSILQQRGNEPDEAQDALCSLTMDDLKTGIRATKPSAIKSITVEVPKVLWSSIGGMDSVKKELREAIELPLMHGDLFECLRIPPPRGLLLYGPPGCSKTLMARALATQGHMNFLAVKGPELLSKWLGESERALASLFRRARAASPSIIFFDEIDAIGCKRGMGEGGGGSSNRLLSQLLTELDGVQHTVSLSSSGNKAPPLVVVVGATNRPDLLDPALTRPGRIDRKIYVGLPDATGREEILRLGLQNRACAPDLDVGAVARDEATSGGFSGAELVAACRDAALTALLEAEEEQFQDGDSGAGGAALEPPNPEPTVRVETRHLLQALAGRKRQITPNMLAFYESYRNQSK